MTMPEVARGERWQERGRAAVRRAPRTLLHDLLEPADTRPAMGQPGYSSWRPVFVVLVVLCAALLAPMQANSLAPAGGGSIPVLTVLLGIAEGGALVAGLFRPVAACGHRRSCWRPPRSAPGRRSAPTCPTRGPSPGCS
ncbi:hypothetical protein [Streptomyces sp. NBC_01471]|uniref:hypothetical protein n=1 Tax=Streptomyces sp. NBC_01471 TaxID=2903879 RepID=UPI00352D09E8